MVLFAVLDCCSLLFSVGIWKEERKGKENFKRKVSCLKWYSVALTVRSMKLLVQVQAYCEKKALSTRSIEQLNTNFCFFWHSSLIYSGNARWLVKICHLTSNESKSATKYFADNVFRATSEMLFRLVRDKLHRHGWSHSSQAWNLLQR